MVMGVRKFAPISYVTISAKLETSILMVQVRTPGLEFMTKHVASNVSFRLTFCSVDALDPMF